MPEVEEREIAVGRLAELAPLTPVTVDGVEIVLARVGDEVFAVGGRCVHYGAPLAEGVLHGRRLICPWHHAVFDVTTGRQKEPPGCGALHRFKTRVAEDGNVRVTVPAAAGEHEEPAFAEPAPGEAAPMVVLGGGAAGTSAVEALRASGYAGRLVLVAAEAALPYDRTLLSKEVLQGAEPPAPVTLHEQAFYDRLGVELRLDAKVRRVDAAGRVVELEGGERIPYEACLVATGGEAKRLDVPGAGLDGVVTLRTREDAERLAERAGRARRVVVVGNSFIALECAASLAARGGIEVTVVAPSGLPFAGLFGEAVAKALLALHEGKGTRFRLNESVAAFEGEGRLAAVVTDSGERLEADLAIVGIGVVPVTGFIEGVERDEDGGIPVDAGMRTAVAGLYAAGDVARFPLPWDPARVRIEHWRLACEGGRVAARNMAGLDTVYDGVPFFWSAQHRILYYVGHARPGAEVVLDGEPGAGPFLAYYIEDGRVTAALGVERNAEMAALQELMRLDGPIEAGRVRGGRFNAVRELDSLPPGITLRATVPAGTGSHLRGP